MTHPKTVSFKYERLDGDDGRLGQRWAVDRGPSAFPPPPSARPPLERTGKGTAALVAPLFLVCFAASELITSFVDASSGAFCHAALVAGAIVLAGKAAYRCTREDVPVHQSRQAPDAGFYTALALPPLIRLCSLAMPSRDFSEPERFGAIAFPLLLATWAAARSNGYGLRHMGLTPRWSSLGVPLDLIVGLSGIAIGYVEYRSIRPEPMIEAIDASRAVAANILLLAAVGITEAILMLGVVQVATASLFGSVVGITYVAALIAIMHAGYSAWSAVILAFAIWMLLATVFRLTGSLLGVMLASGIANVCLLAIFPLAA